MNKAPKIVVFLRAINYTIVDKKLMHFLNYPKNVKDYIKIVYAYRITYIFKILLKLIKTCEFVYLISYKKHSPEYVYTLLVFISFHKFS